LPFGVDTHSELGSVLGARSSERCNRNKERREKKADRFTLMKKRVGGEEKLAASKSGSAVVPLPTRVNAEGDNVSAPNPSASGRAVFDPSRTQQNTHDNGG